MSDPSGHLCRPMMIRLPDALREKIEARAAYERRTLSAMARIILEDAIEAMPPTPAWPMRAGTRKR